MIHYLQYNPLKLKEENLTCDILKVELETIETCCYKKGDEEVLIWGMIT